MEKQFLFDLDLTLSKKEEYSPIRRKEKNPPKKTSYLSRSGMPCDRCEIKGIPVSPRPSTKENPVMIIGAYPGKIETEEGVVFSGDSGILLHEILGLVGFEYGDTYETNIFKCPRPVGADGKLREIEVKELRNCGWFVEKEIQAVQPSLIILCGELPLRYFFNRKFVNPVRGQIKVKGDYKFLITFNPAHIMREKEDSPDSKAFERDIKSAYEIYKGISRISKQEYKLVSSLEELDVVVKECFDAKEVVSLDIESYAPGKWEDKRALDPYAEGFKVISIALTAEENKGYCILLEHPENKIDLETVKAKLRPLVESKVPKVGQSLKFDYKVLLVHWGWRIGNIVFDTELGSSLLDERKGIHNLDRLVLDWLGERSYKYEAQGIGSYIPDAKSLCIRNCSDSDYTFRIYSLIKQRLIQEGLYDYYMEQRIPVISALAEMEAKGLPVDREYTEGLLKTYEDRLEILVKKINNYSEVASIQSFNINSNDDLQTLFFEKLKFESVRKTKTGFSTDKEVLKELSKKYNHSIITDIQDYKELEKFKSTYLAPLLRHQPNVPMSPHIKYDGCVHPTFTLHVAASGRLSCVNPNVQNVPFRVKGAKEIMDCYAAPGGYSIGLGDYEQQELRILAQISKDSKMLEAFRNNEDLHTKTAIETSKIAGIEMSRDDGKGLNFGIVYGMTQYGLANELGIDKNTAQLYIDSYLKLYEGVAEYQERQKNYLRQYGYVKTLFGRKRWIKLYGDGNESNKRNAEAYRKAINTPVQGTGCDVTILAMTTLVKMYIESGFKSFPISNIHDSIMFLMSDEEKDDLKELNVFIMENLPLPWLTDVKLKVSWSSGRTWGDCKKKE